LSSVFFSRAAVPYLHIRFASNLAIEIGFLLATPRAVARTFFSGVFLMGFLDGFFFFRGLERVGPTEQMGSAWADPWVKKILPAG
jgi:hypothetical protein